MSRRSDDQERVDRVLNGPTGYVFRPAIAQNMYKGQPLTDEQDVLDTLSYVLANAGNYDSFPELMEGKGEKK